MDVATFSAGLTLPMITGAAGVVLVLVVAAIIYRFSIQEKSFEEVIEEQKRQKLEEEQQQKLKKNKKEKVFKRSWANKKKDKAERDVTPDVALVEEKLEIPVIEIIEPKETKPLKLKNKKPSSSSQNANNTSTERSEKSDVAVGSDRPIQEKKRESPIVDKKKDVSDKKKDVPVSDKKKDVSIFEKKKDISAIEKKKEASVSEKEVEKLKVVEKHTDVLKSKENVSVQSSISANSSNKKKKKDIVEKVTAVETLTASKLLSLIKEAALDTDEIQNLIDILLNKQKDSVHWHKKNDQLASTKRDLHEKEQQLDLELRQNQAVVLKLKDLREEYNQMKVKYTALEKGSQERITKQQQDIQTFTARVKQLNEQFTAEKEKSAQLEKQMEEKISAALKTIEEEKTKLVQKIAKLEAESRSGSSKNDFEAMKKSKEDLQKVNNLLVEQHTQLVATHKKDLQNLSNKVASFEKQFEEVSAKNTILIKDVQALKESKTALESSKKTLEEKLKAEEKRYNELDQQSKQLSAKLANVNQLQLEMKSLQSENGRLTEQLVSTKERVAGDGQEIIHQNGEINGKIPDEASSKDLKEKDKLIKEKELLLIQVNEECSKLKTKVSILDQEIEEQKKKNNELREKNWKAMDALKNAEQGAEQKLKEIKSAHEQKLSEIEKKLKSSDNTQSNISPELTERLKKVESDYNSELEKNKKMAEEVERLSSHQKSLESRLYGADKSVQDLSTQIKSCEMRTKECLMRIHPHVKVDNSLPYDAWLPEFQKQATLSVISSSDEELSRLKSQLEDKNKELLLKESEIKEVMMSTLQKVQESAEANEIKWRESLQQKEAELQKVIAERDALSSEKEALQSTFQQVEQLEDLQVKLKLLQDKVRSAENDRAHLEQKYDEVNKNYINYRDQLEIKEKQIAELEKDKNSNHLSQEIEDLKLKLEKERKINKDFSSQMIRLNSLVKIGQDSLSVEQETVKKLRSQLEAQQTSAANGNPPATVQSSVHGESKSKSKSSEKSKKKMDASAKK